MIGKFLLYNLPYIVALLVLLKMKLLNETNIILLLSLAIIHNSLVYQGSSSDLRFLFLMLYVVVLCVVILQCISKMFLGINVINLIKGFFIQKNKSPQSNSTDISELIRDVYVGIESL